MLAKGRQFTFVP